MESLTHIPPGYRFHPTDEELVDYYLKKKVAFPGMQVDVIKDVDLYKIEPWDIQGLYTFQNLISMSLAKSLYIYWSLDSKSLYTSCLVSHTL